MPVDYGRDPRVEYEAITQGVTLWDVGAERQAQLRGPDALRVRRLPEPAQPARPRRRALPLHAGLRSARRDHGRLHRAPAVRGHGLVLALGRRHLALGLRARARPRRARRGRGGRRRAAAAAGPARRDRARAALRRRSRRAASLRLRRDRGCGLGALVVSNTGWSKEQGYELYPLGSARCVELWDALVAAGEPHGLMVTGPNINRAVEQGITDTQYKMNSGMTALEAGLEPLLHLDGEAFMGREALVAERARGSRRRTIGLLVDGPEFPPFEDFWPVADVAGETVGVARWGVFSYALEQNIAIALVDVAVRRRRRAHRARAGR